MKLEISLRYAQRAVEAINDDRYLRKMLEQSSTNVFEFCEGDDDVDELIDALVSRLENVVPDGEYSIELNQ